MTLIADGLNVGRDVGERTREPPASPEHRGAASSGSTSRSSCETSRPDADSSEELFNQQVGRRERRPLLIDQVGSAREDMPTSSRVLNTRRSSARASSRSPGRMSAASPRSTNAMAPPASSPHRWRRSAGMHVWPRFETFALTTKLLHRCIVAERQSQGNVLGRVSLRCPGQHDARRGRRPDAAGVGGTCRNCA